MPAFPEEVAPRQHAPRFDHGTSTICRASSRASSAVADRLHRAAAADLEAWAENVLDARTLDDVFDADARGPGP